MIMIFWIWVIGALCILGLGATAFEKSGNEELAREVFGLFVLLALFWPLALIFAVGGTAIMAFIDRGQNERHRNARNHPS